jgi:hypothetical protein
MAWFGDFLHRYPDLVVYLAVGLGYLIGGYKIEGFGLGPVTGSLFAGLLIGQLGHVPASGTAKSILFLMFIFGIGYSVGPQFFHSLKGDGGRSAVLLPEAFAGLDRNTNFPIPYPTACSPQAWATGAPFVFLQVMLGLDAPNRQITLDPRIPEEIGCVQIHGLSAFAFDGTWRQRAQKGAYGRRHSR